MNAVVRPATAADLSSAADVLAEAFRDYAWTRYVIPEENYPDRLRELQYLYLSHALSHGFVAVTEDLDGVIALLPPDASDPDEATLERILALHGDRISRLQSGAAVTDQAGGDDRAAWTLETVGVRPAGQGRGLGGALVAFGLAKAHARGAAYVRLETSDERNVRLYRRYGFEVTGRADRPGGPRVWRMRATVPGLHDDGVSPVTTASSAVPTTTP
ncbi:GNAT family N-acetyltransferase [Sediminivirga luteola]|uniref:GNAT family N-acetyltransferase n=1 Tax=Sediminivirga luteola TaxID=1774748 RepID=UPI001F55D9EA|nr:GNAT family N-acetyltransferase [Sediminivirga luteola]MCI2266032.1 GNAT family N-acetyltransferase [Sediminivirga luteola]